MAIEVRPLTMAVRMRAGGILRIASRSWQQDAMQEYEVDEESMLIALIDFCMYSARIICNGDDALPFELGIATDDANALKRKFDSYMEALTSGVDELDRLIEATDAPHDAELAPDVELTDPEV